jgi:protein TonB
MQARAELPPSVRWGGALAIVLALHATAAWMLLSHGFPPMVMPAAPEAVLLDLAPDLPPVQEAAVEPPAPAALPPPPPPPVPETPPVTPMPVVEPPPVELPPTPQVEAEVVLPIPPPPPPPPRPQLKPKPRPVVERPVQPQPTPRVADDTPRAMAPAPVQAAPAQASSRPPAPVSTVTPSWRSDLLARLQRAKRYPDQARSHGDQGVATTTFTMDRSGRVLSVGLVRSSGSTLLDEEAVALVRRAEPLPSLPDEMPGSTITLTVPISFALR